MRFKQRVKLNLWKQAKHTFVPQWLVDDWFGLLGGQKYLWILMEEESGQQVTREKHWGKEALEQFTKKKEKMWTASSSFKQVGSRTLREQRKWMGRKVIKCVRGKRGQAGPGFTWDNSKYPPGNITLTEYLTKFMFITKNREAARFYSHNCIDSGCYFSRFMPSFCKNNSTVQLSAEKWGFPEDPILAGSFSLVCSNWTMESLTGFTWIMNCGYFQKERCWQHEMCIYFLSWAIYTSSPLILQRGNH